MKNLNNTDIGLTPKEKKKTQSRLISTSTTVKPRPPPKKIQPNNIQLNSQRESLFEHTAESWNLNVSSSTIVDTLPSAVTTLNYSPIVEKCMEKFETIIDKKMLQWMENLHKASIAASKNNGTTPKQKAKDCENESATIRSELKSVMRELLLEKEEPAAISEVERTVKEKCRLFTTSSPVLKVPENPVRKRKRNTELQDLQSNASNNITMLEESLSNETMRHVRRSKRLLELTYCNNLSINNSERNVRIAAGIEGAKPKVNAKTKRKTLVNNVVAGYSCEAHSIKKHRKAILELLNNGSMKNLQILPQVGPKTAFQLVTHRTLTGKFKTIAHVEKLPVWRGNAWERFAMANMLI